MTAPSLLRLRILALPLVIAGAGPLLAADQTPRDMMFACMGEQHGLAPALRAATCQCFVEKVQTRRFRLEAAFAADEKTASLRGNVVKECLAAEYHRF